MKQNWNISEEIEKLTLTPKEIVQLDDKYKSTRLGFAILLKFFQIEFRFPESKQDVPDSMLRFIAKQLKLPLSSYETYLFESKTCHRHKREITQLCQFREENIADRQQLDTWLSERVYAYNLDTEVLKEKLYLQYQEHKRVCQEKCVIKK